MRVKYYDYEKYIGWYSDALIDHFEKGFTFKNEDYKTVGDFVELVKSKLKSFDSYVDSPFPGDGSIMLKTNKDNVRYIIDEGSKVPLCRLLEKYSINDEIPITVRLIIGGRGEVLHDEGKCLGVVFKYHSEERNHIGRPHVHIIDRNTFAEISIDLKTVEIIEYSNAKKKPRFSKRKIDNVQTYIREHLTIFQNYWNEITNGLKIEIDM